MSSSPIFNYLLVVSFSGLSSASFSANGRGGGGRWSSLACPSAQALLSSGACSTILSLENMDLGSISLASDAEEVLSPVSADSSVAELAANELGDDVAALPVPGAAAVAGGPAELQGDQLEVNRGVFTVWCPIRDIEDCPLCRRVFNSMYDLDRHIKSDHATSTISWGCRDCRRTFEKVHGCRIHLGLCKGAPTPALDDPVPPGFVCEVCQSSFKTQRGLAQHERHRHPGVRNQHRLELANAPHSQPGRLWSVWSPEEMLRLEQLNETYRACRYPNKELQRFFPNKTLRQISDARRRLPQRPPIDNAIEELVDIPPAGEGSSPGPAPRADDVIESGGGALGTLGDDRASSPGNISPAQPASASPRSSSSARPPNELDALELHEDSRVSSPGGVPLAGQASLPFSPSPPARPSDTLQNWQEALIPVIFDLVELIPTHLKPAFRAIWDSVEGPASSKLDRLWEETLFSFLKSDDAENREGPPNRSRRGRRRRRRSGGSRPANRTERRRFQYSRCQEIFKKCPKRLVDAIEADDFSLLGAQEPPPADQVQPVYREIWEQTGEFHLPPPAPSQQVDCASLFAPISEAEVRAKIKRIDSSSSPGPDGMVKSHLTKPGTVPILAGFFNLLLLYEHYPTSWRRNRTTLIPKAGRDKSDVKNWRPITVGSLVGRIYSSILDSRLRTVIELHGRQRGFISENGCRGNTAILEEAIRQAKSESGGVFSILDMFRAFDVIPHAVIKHSLLSKGIPKTVADYVCNMYRDCTTVIKTAKGNSVEVHLMRGVKQGDPLSPLLFNTCIDHILGSVEDLQVGLNVDGSPVSILAFADDLVLIGQNADSAQAQLDKVQSLLRCMGMTLSPQKCSSFQIVPHQKTWYIKDPALSIENAPVKYIGPDEVTRYLGLVVGPWKGLLRGTEVGAIKHFLLGLAHLPLKPMQKVHLLKTHIMPKFVYSLSMTIPSSGVLKMIDTEVRMCVKRILHLVESTTSHFFYAANKSGGLGLMRFEHTIPIAILRNGAKLMQSSDPVCRAVVSNHRWTTVLEHAARAVRLVWPASLDDIEASKQRLRAQNLADWGRLLAQGQGLHYFQNDDVGNRWLSNSSLLKASRISDAIRLRTNTFGTRATLSRYNPGLDVRCRRCGYQRETLGHILGSCVATKPSRIHRHDEIKNLIANRWSNRGRVMVESSWCVGGVLYKPDLIVIDEKRALVVDVTVRYENQSYLSKACREKVDKYSPLLPDIKAITRKDTVEVIPIVVGSRGSLPIFTKKRLKYLGIGRADWLTISLIALRSSIEIANRFLDD